MMIRRARDGPLLLLLDFSDGLEGVPGAVVSPPRSRIMRLGPGLVDLTSASFHWPSVRLTGQL